MKKALLLAVLALSIITTSAFAVPTVITDNVTWTKNYEWTENGRVGFAATDYWSANGVTRDLTGAQVVSTDTYDGKTYDVFHVNAGTYTGSHQGTFDKANWGLSFYSNKAYLTIFMTDLSNDSSDNETAIYYFGQMEKYGKKAYFGSENFGNNWYFSPFFDGFDPTKQTDYLVTVKSNGNNYASGIIRVGDGLASAPPVVPAPSALILGSIGAAVIGFTKRNKK